MFARLPHLLFRMRCAPFSMLHRSLSDLPHSALYLFHPVPPPFVKRFSQCSERCLEPPRRYRLVCLDQLRVFTLCEPLVGFGCAILNHLPCPRHDCRSYPATRLAISRVSLFSHQSRQPGHERVITPVQISDSFDEDHLWICPAKQSGRCSCTKNGRADLFTHRKNSLRCICPTASASQHSVFSEPARSSQPGRLGMLKLVDLLSTATWKGSRTSVFRQDCEVSSHGRAA